MDCNSLGDCADDRIVRIYEYLDGALTLDDLKEVKSHLEGCPECTEQYDLECIIRSVVRRSCQEHAPQTLKASIISRRSRRVRGSFMFASLSCLGACRGWHRHACDRDAYERASTW